MMPLGSILLVLALYVLVTARITRLVNYDVVLDPIRLAIARRASTAHTGLLESGDVEEQMKLAARYNRWTTVADFLACPWCVGFWMSVALAPAPIAVIGWPLWTWLVLPWACSYLVGVGDRWVGEDVEIVKTG